MYWEAKATMLHNFILLYVYSASELCNAVVLQEAFLVNSKILKGFPCLSNLEAPKFLTSSGCILFYIYIYILCDLWDLNSLTGD